MTTSSPSHTSPALSPTSNTFYDFDYEFHSQNRATIESYREYFSSHYLTPSSLNTLNPAVFEERLLRLLESLKLTYFDPHIFREAVLILIASASKPISNYYGLTNIHTSLEGFAQTFNEVDYQANQIIDELQE